ncbi:MAG: hypothetical protein WA152_02325 [Microgenomates group bacterium]
MINFIKAEWFNVIIILILLFPLIPTSWLGTDDTYTLQDGTARKRVRFNLITAISLLVIQPLVQTVLSISILFNFKTTIGLLIFSVVGVELFLKRQVSQQSVILVAISLIALYLEQLIDKAKRISIWKIFDWEAK